MDPSDPSKGQRRSSYVDDFEEEGDSSGSPKSGGGHNQLDGEDDMHFRRIPSESNSPSGETDPFSQDDSGINEAEVLPDGDPLGPGGDPLSKEFVRPFPPPSSRTSYRYRSGGDSSDVNCNPNSPSVSVHIMNVPSPLALPPPTRWAAFFCISSFLEFE